MINQFVVILFFFNWSMYDSDQTGLLCECTHAKNSQFYMPIKIFVKNSFIMMCCINVFLGTLS